MTDEQEDPFRNGLDVQERKGEHRKVTYLVTNHVILSRWVSPLKYAPFPMIINFFQAQTQLNMKFVLLINLKLLTPANSHHENISINFDPLKPHFYIVKLRFTGVNIIFLISAQNIDCGYSLELPRRGGSKVYPQSMFCAEI